MPAKVLKISESKWLHAGKNGGLNKRGEPPKKDNAAFSSLKCDVNGRMCCLGFVAKKAGAKNIVGFGSIEDLSRKDKRGIKKAFPFLLDGEPLLDSAISFELIAANDDWKITNAQRKARIKKIFKENGVEVIFVP